ncbi:Uncharacterised protein [Vibrio cholerae]|nr:Uncharacterised protein [Vibrio cholerae]
MIACCIMSANCCASCAILRLKSSVWCKAKREKCSLCVIPSLSA